MTLAEALAKPTLADWAFWLSWSTGALLWCFSLWLYADAKRWRERGVAIRPGLAAGSILFLYLAAALLQYALKPYLAFLERPVVPSAFGYAWQFAMPIAAAILFSIILVLHGRMQKAAMVSTRTLLPPPSWTTWFFALVLLAFLAAGIFVLVRH